MKDDEETVWIDGVVEESISATQPFFVAPGHVGFGFQNVAPWPSIKVASNTANQFVVDSIFERFFRLLLQPCSGCQQLS